ncbi:SUN domain-containing ossification factor-like isoform X2 [Centroberyx affinis]|uniref:SUN domain-containing ossification factor-like isoform X2 n=1 Tax=Centroberyx affinis TaxID=166261 RepID=UPI003A5C1AD2
MMMTPLLWRVLSVWLFVALLCWHSSCYVGCTEPHQEAQRLLPTQDISSEEEPGENTHHHKVEESWVLHIQSLSEDEQLIVGDDRPKEELTTQGLDNKEQDAELNIFLIICQALEVEEPDAELEPEPEKGMPEPEPEPEQDSEKQLPETSITQDQDSASSSETSPPSAGPVTTPAAEPEDHPSILTTQDDTPNSVSDDVEVAEVPPLELNDADVAPADCEAEEANPYDDASPPVVLENTSNAHTAGTKTHTDPPLSPQSGHGTQRLEANTSHMLKEQGLSSTIVTENDSTVSSKDPEDIPTFDEWKRKEVEKEKTQATHTSTNGGSHPVKKVQKNFNNYASVECGAKILGSNPEAKSTSAILKENMDLYMLNPCSNKIWFIIELCEPIQVKQLDIANFELFSSTPKDFLVSISDRYPTNKWLKLGTFHARDERTVQSFPLDEHLYAKYVKVELVSHFGSEHFCPLSLIRVFGTSMVEEYEEIADPSERPDDQDDDLDYLPGYVPGEVKSSNNLIGSAKDVILNMVNNIAVNVLGGGPEMQGNISSQELNMTEPASQIETTTQGTTTDLVSVPDSEVVQTFLDPDIPATETPSPEPSVPEIPTTDTTLLELPPVEEKIVTPLQEDEEEPISSTITLLDKEEETEEEREKKEQHERQQESLDYCALFPLSSSSPHSSSCSCSASLLEYLQQQCSALLSKKRTCQTMEREQTIPPHIQTPTWQLPLSPSACPVPQQDHNEIHPPQEKDHAPGQGERGASPSEEPHPPADLTEAQKESSSEPPLLEPSQTSKLPKPSTTDSSSAKPTPTVEPPQLSSKEPPKELRPEKSQDVPDEEKHEEPSATISASTSTKSSVSATADDISVAPTEEKPNIDFYLPELDTSIQTPDVIDQSQALHPTPSPPSEQHPAPTAVPENGSAPAEASHPAPNTVAEPEPSSGHSVTTETKMEDLVEDIIFTSSSGNGQLSRPSSPTSPPSSSSQPHSDVYAELHNGVEQANGNQVHGSSQKESVFMRLNNRIKALEMNMSLSGRYLEQLSQRYRKQMEEMQRAFNKTIIKLQNTSRIAEEQDQRQTVSIQLLQGQLENVTQLVLNLSVRVSQLQNEVSDRQNYLLLSLMLCLFLGLLLCANHCRISTMPPNTEPEPPIPKSYSYCCPERQFSSCDDSGLKRRASYPLLHSESFQLATTEGPETLHTEETQRLSAANRKRRRSKIKPSEKVETLKPSLHAAPELANGAVVCNGVPLTTNLTSPTRRLLQPTFRDSPSEGSSEGSSHSDDPSFCGIATACNRICDGLPPPKTRAEKRALRRRRPKPGYVVVDLVQAPCRDKSESLPISTLQDVMSRKTEQSSGTFGVNATLSGPA